MKLTCNWFSSSSSFAHDSKSWRCNYLLEKLAVAAPAVTRHDKTTAIFFSFVCSWPHAVVVWSSRDAGGGGGDDWILFFLLSERKGTEERKKDSASFRVSLSFFLSWGSSCNHQQQQPPFAHSQNARCPAHKYERETETYCKLLPTVPKQQLELN